MTVTGMVNANDLTSSKYNSMIKYGNWLQLLVKSDQPDYYQQDGMYFVNLQS